VVEGDFPEINLAAAIKQVDARIREIDGERLRHAHHLRQRRRPGHRPSVGPRRFAPLPLRPDERLEVPIQIVEIPAVRGLAVEIHLDRRDLAAETVELEIARDLAVLVQQQFLDHDRRLHVLVGPFARRRVVARRQPFAELADHRVFVFARLVAHDPVLAAAVVRLEHERRRQFRKPDFLRAVAFPDQGDQILLADLRRHVRPHGELVRGDLLQRIAHVQLHPVQLLVQRARVRPVQVVAERPPELSFNDAPVRPPAVAQSLPRPHQREQRPLAPVGLAIHPLEPRPHTPPYCTPRPAKSSRRRRRGPRRSSRKSPTAAPGPLRSSLYSGFESGTLDSRTPTSTHRLTDASQRRTTLGLRRPWASGARDGIFQRRHRFILQPQAAESGGLRLKNRAPWPTFVGR